jgi:hypothetical protein
MYGNETAAKDAGYASDRTASGQIRGGLAGASEARQLELPCELARLEKAVEYADHTVNELVNRLEGKVTSSRAPEPVNAGGKLSAAGPSSMYATEVHNAHRRVTELAERMHDLLRRLEV